MSPPVFFEGRIHSVSELEAVYARLVKEFSDRTLILLSGPVGAGKTTSTQAFLNILGFESGSSPSFAIHQRYDKAGTNRHVDHVDLYRIEDTEDLEGTGFWDLFSQANAIVIVEWADRIDSQYWPLNWRQIYIEIQPVLGHPEKRDLRISF